MQATESLQYLKECPQLQCLTLNENPLSISKAEVRSLLPQLLYFNDEPLRQDLNVSREQEEENKLERSVMSADESFDRLFD